MVGRVSATPSQASVRARRPSELRSRLPRGGQPRHRLVITIRQRRRLHAARPASRTPRGSPSLPPLSSHSPSSDRALTTTRARLQGPQDRTVGRDAGHPWEKRWPPTGKFDDRLRGAFHGHRHTSRVEQHGQAAPREGRHSMDASFNPDQTRSCGVRKDAFVPAVRARRRGRRSQSTAESGDSRTPAVRHSDRRGSLARDD
jgi:hypothetical protein